ncbi:MAG: protein kinase [Acidimicrobiales bacterium]|nr:protein kinase [Acidimicrobiales bacterium]
MEFRVLGPLEARRDGQVIELGAYRRRSLLALFLTAPNTVLSTDRIIDALWGESEANRQKALWVHISGLRSALEPDRKKRTDGTILLTRPPGYVLRIPPDSIDAERFQRQVEAGRATLEADPAATARLLRDALALWRGSPFADFEYEQFAQPEIARLEALRLDAIGARIDADLRCGRTRELVHELESLVRLHPLREELTGQLMVALYRSGRQADALRAYQLLRSRLTEELGLDPSEPLRRLETQILTGDPALDLAPSVPVAPDVSGLTVRSYALREQIGRTPAGPTYRAHQASVERDVAITIVRPEQANEPDFIRRFEASAQVVAQLEHPHILPLYDYWREPDAAYLVTRLIGTRTLRDLIADEASVLDHVLRIAEQVGGALEAAHGAGLVHGDIRPDSVMIDGDGNAYLSNIGIAPAPRALRLMDTDAETRAPYISPEELTGAGATAASDVYSFGVLVAQAIVGRLDPIEDLRASLAPAVRDVIDEATDRDPTERPQLPRDLVTALRATVGVPEPADAGPRAALPNPYKGLRAFDTSDAEYFAGRERIVADLLRRIDEPGRSGRFVALVGPSGSGKSSIVRAGVVPALRRGEVAGSERWFITTMTPGSRPFEALENAVRSVAVDPPVNLLERLVSDGIVPAVRPLLLGAHAELVVLIDQFEELFSLGSPSVAESFMRAVATAVEADDPPVRFLITLRADFYDHPLRHRSFAPLLEARTVLITPMSEEELQRAITAPAAAAGVDFEPGLTAHIEADMGRQTTALPLLQYALTELFEQRSGSTMTTEAYRRLGGVAGALSRRAESLYENLSPPDQELCREIFVRLVTLNEQGPDTRRRATIAELSDGDRDELDRVLETFGRARLLSFDRDAASRSPTVEAAHEALIEEWTRLRTWIDHARSDIRLQRRLAAAADYWSDNGRDPDYLLKGSQLGPYVGWIDSAPVRLTGSERTYLLASTEQEERGAAIERRRVRRLRRLVVGVGAALVLALIASGVAVRQRERAEEQAATAVEATNAAEVATLISRAAAAGGDDPELGLLLALEARRRQPGPETDRAVLASLGTASIASRIITRDALESDCGPSGRGFGREVATIDGRMVARDALSGDLLDLGLAPARCAVGDRDEDMGFAQATAGRTLWLGPDLDTELQFDQRTTLREMSPDRALAVRNQTAGDEVLVFDARTGQQVGSTVSMGFVSSTAHSEDGSLFAVTASVSGIGIDGPSEGSTVVIDARSGEVRLDRNEPAFGNAFFDQTSGELIVASFDGTLSVIDPTTGASIQTLDTGVADAPRALWARGDGTLVAAYFDHVRFVDVETGVIRDGPPVDELAAATLTSDRYLTVWSVGGDVAVYDLATNAVLGETYGVSSGHQAIGAGSVGIVDRRGVEASVSVLDLSTGAVSVPLLPDADGMPFDPLALFPAEDGLWAVSADHVLAHWQGVRLVDALYLGSVDGVTGGLWQGSGTLFGDYFAVHGRRPDRTEEAVLVRLRPGPPEVVLTVETGALTGVLHPTGDGGLHVIGDDGMVTTYDADGNAVDTMVTPATSPGSVALDPSGIRLAIGSTDTNGVVVVDLETRAIDTVPGVSAATTFGFNADGSVLAMSLRDGTVRLHIVGGGAPVTVFTGSVGSAAEPGWFDPETDSVWMPIGDSVVEVLLDPDVWAERACGVLSRDFTPTEWDLYVPGDLPLEPACSEGT